MRMPKITMKLTKKQQDFMDAGGHVLVTGGPGSGKTTVAILKAANIAESQLLPAQKVLFLSFARATISRVIEAIEYEQKIPKPQRKCIEVDTYHSFYWRIIKTHGYLIGIPRNLSILTPSNEAISLSTIRNSYKADGKLSAAEKKQKVAEIKVEQVRLAFEDGIVCFDLFAELAKQILLKSNRIREIIANKYPVIIFDEFQDTNADQWEIIKSLGTGSRLLALADPEQRIYDWIGADPKRLDHFRETFTAAEIDLSTDNHRSAGTDIGVFANDVLTGDFRDEDYVGIEIVPYRSHGGQPLTKLITTTYAARSRLVAGDSKDWSLAILVPTKKMTRVVSDALSSPPAGMAQISHSAVVDMEAIVLSAEVVAFALQTVKGEEEFTDFVSIICDYFEGRGGDKPTKGSLNEAANIRKQREKYLSKGGTISKTSILTPIVACFEKLLVTELSGNAESDWLTVRKIMEDAGCKRLKQIAEEVKNVRLLEKGEQLRSSLVQDWRDNGRYKGALNVIRQSFLQEYFSTKSKPETGVVVMNMHKSKGKQFDEVILFENWPSVYRGEIKANYHRFVWGNLVENVDDQSRQNLRVSITRGKKRTTILTPRANPCVLLP